MIDEVDIASRVAALTAAAYEEEAVGHPAAARALAQEAVGLVDELGSRALWCDAQLRLAQSECFGGDLDAAERRLLAVLDRAQTGTPPLLGSVMAALNSLGVVYKYAGRFDEADDAYHRALILAEAAEQPDRLILASIYHNLGGLDHARGRPAPGIVWAERGLKLRVADLGSDHLDAARDLAALGGLYQQAGQPIEAANAYERSLAVFETCLGPHHFEVGMTIANMAALASDDGRHSDAVSLGTRALRILEEVLGPDHPEVGLTLHNLGVAQLNAGRTKEAGRALRRARHLLGASLSSGHPQLDAVNSALDLVRATPAHDRREASGT